MFPVIPSTRLPISLDPSLPSLLDLCPPAPSLCLPRLLPWGESAARRRLREMFRSARRGQPSSGLRLPSPARSRNRRRTCANRNEIQSPLDSLDPRPLEINIPWGPFELNTSRPWFLGSLVSITSRHQVIPPPGNQAISLPCNLHPHENLETNRPGQLDRQVPIPLYFTGAAGHLRPNSTRHLVAATTWEPCASCAPFTDKPGSAGQLVILVIRRPSETRHLFHQGDCVAKNA
jgi:hypothetical protein